MGTLIEDIKPSSDWIVKGFQADGLKLDYTIDSFIEIDKFFNIHAENGVAKRGGRLSKDLGYILFSLGAYIGETIIKNVPGSIWITNDDDPEGEVMITVKLPNGSEIYPVQRVIKRFENGAEDAIYVYGHIVTKEFTNETFNGSFWVEMKQEKPAKPWWKIW